MIVRALPTRWPVRACVLLLMVAGCVREKRAAVPAAPARTSETTVTMAQVAIPQRLELASPSLAISSQLLEACRMRPGSVSPAPFDHDNLLLEDREVLRKVADCVSTGPLRGRRIHLVGHARITVRLSCAGCRGRPHVVLLSVQSAA